MENWCKLLSGCAAGIAGCFAPVAPLVGCAFLFVGIDFVTGVAADCAVARRAGRRWYFESGKARRTLVKLALTLTTIVMAGLLDALLGGLLPFDAARICTGFACGVEFWSFLENAAQLSDAPFFRLLRRYLRRQMADKTGDRQA